MEKYNFGLISSKRSQSALEYMMTYGWAILIIVIVAVILYSMGIFNPSSSISTTITGFSSTPVSAAIFTNNGGLSLSVENSVGYPIEITNITATSATGGKVIILPNITLLPGKSQVLVFSKIFTAANQGSHISTAVTITYKEISQPLPGPYISTGSITGSTPSVVYPSNYTFAAVSKLTITNSQSSATPNPFQQMVNITSADNGFQLISPDFGQNVEFFYSNGTVIPSWLESYSSSNAIWWLKIGSIPASSSITVYMGIAPTSTNLFNNVNDGEAPQLTCPNPSNTASCSTYAEYDDGANVFNYYTNFSGTSLPSGWIETVSVSGNTYSVDNGLTLTATNGNVLVLQYSNAFNPQTNILDFYGHFENQGFGGVGYTPNDGYPMASPGSIGIGVDIPIPNAYLTRASGSTEIQIDSLTLGTTPYLFSLWESPSEMYGQANYQYTTSNSNDFTAETSLYPGVMLAQRSGTDYMFIQYLRVRAYPPNGVIPSVSFGSVA